MRYHERMNPKRLPLTKCGAAWSHMVHNWNCFEHPPHLANGILRSSSTEGNPRPNARHIGRWADSRTVGDQSLDPKVTCPLFLQLRSGKPMVKQSIYPLNPTMRKSLWCVTSYGIQVPQQSSKALKRNHPICQE